MALDQESGLDPPHIKLRACEGLDAIEFFVPGYPVWGKVTEALSDVGYDPNNLVRSCVRLRWWPLQALHLTQPMLHQSSAHAGIISAGL